MDIDIHIDIQGKHTSMWSSFLVLSVLDLRIISDKFNFLIVGFSNFVFRITCKHKFCVILQKSNYEALELLEKAFRYNAIPPSPPLQREKKNKRLCMNRISIFMNAAQNLGVGQKTRKGIVAGVFRLLRGSFTTKLFQKVTLS